jgi:hypothetical protein
LAVSEAGFNGTGFSRSSSQQPAADSQQLFFLGLRFHAGHSSTILRKFTANNTA